jgi:hypothetical protein
MNTIPIYYTPPTREEFDKMSDEQKRTTILQVQQFETFKVVKTAAQVFIYSFFISLLIAIMFAANIFIG